MPTTPSNQDAALFSDSETEKRVEINFAKRLLNYVGGLNVAEIHELVNSGEFNNIFPALDDEATRVPPRRFEDLKPFDYQAWANRNRIKD
jgi:hypothetical protein